ncbi:hypothetical protein ACJJTC_018826 [Scirpophaga incertulas]
MNLPRPLKAHIDRTEKIKWKELHTDKGLNFLEWVHTYVTNDKDCNKSADQMWTDFEKSCIDQAKTVLGVSRGALRQHKETSWWNASVKDLVNSKRDAFKKWQKTNLEKDRLEYKCLKKIAKTAIIIQSNKPLRYLTAHEEEAAHQPPGGQICKKRSSARICARRQVRTEISGANVQGDPTLDKLGRGLDKEEEENVAEGARSH